MANAIVAALEQAARRLGKSLSRDAAAAVEKMYRDAGTGVERVVKNIADADAAHAQQFLALAERLGQNNGKRLGKAAARRHAAIESHVNRVLDPTTAAEHDIEAVVDSRKYPETAQHIREAQSGTIWRGDVSTQGQPKPSVVTIGPPSGSDDNREKALRGIPTVDGMDRDEYPPAMFREGGAGASAKYVSGGDNKGAGAAIGNQIRGLPPDTRVRIRVK